MIRVSAGTASCMGLNSIRMDAYPTTAYLLSGNRCLMKCAFCPQGNADSMTISRLGRVGWPEYSWTDVEEGISMIEKKGLRRICLQSVRHASGITPLLEAVVRLKKISTLPLSLSAWIRDEEEAGALFAAGAERISISLDAVNPAAYARIKSGSLHERLELLLRSAGRYPGRMSTHVICGLGETEAETLLLMDSLLQKGITVALFAFVPLKGTPFQEARPPAIDSYRRIQAGCYLLRKKAAPFSSFRFENGHVKSLGLPGNKLRQVLADGEAFQTSGCPGCNRPYYNESPGGLIYNYPRRLGLSEKEDVLCALFKTLQT